MSGFFWIGNHRGLDLLNTAAADDTGAPVELLADFEALATWIEETGAVPAINVWDVAPAHRDGLLRWVRRLRDAGRRVVETRDDDGTGADAAARLDSIVAEVPVRLAYSLRPVSETPVDAAEPHDRIRLALALAVLDATRLDPLRVRICGRPGCVLLFFDTSRNRGRRWCDMAVCGNRMKVAAHYERSRRDPSAIL